jgi:serine/threonine-protein kinase
MATMPGAADDPLLGQTLKGTYRIDHCIAVGGMGAVYRAEHIRLRRPVAVKVVLWQPGRDAQLAERFEQEVDAIAQVGHPHIVQVIDFDRSEGGMPYMVMEYLEGETLEACMERTRPLPVAMAVSVVSQVASALADVHARGIVHRDLKPANVYLVHATGEECFVKLLDFGVSKMRTSAERATGTHEVVGTPEFMAPEQAQGGHQDQRVDQFALATIAYEMLTGQQPFTAEELTTVLYRVLTVDPPRVSELAPWAPDQIDDVIRRALSKDPAKRYPTISQFAYALESAAVRSGIGREPRYSPVPPSLVGEARSTSIQGSAPDADREIESARTVLSRPPVAPPATPTLPSVPSARSAKPASVPPSGHNEEATSLYLAVRTAREAGDLEGAVSAAEKLLEFAAYDADPSVPAVLARAMPLLDDVFSTYVGSLDGEIQAGPDYGSVRQMNLSRRAADLLGLMEQPTRISAVFRHAGIPERAGVRLLAGLLRRGVLTRV